MTTRPGLTYTQASGFAEYELPQELRWLDGESGLGSWRKRVGYTKELWGAGEHPLDSELGVRRNAFAWAAESANFPHHRYLVVLSDCDTWDDIYVPDYASLIDLKLRLTAFVVAELCEDVAALRTMARRAFRAWHRHESYDVCQVCDPQQVATDRHRRREWEAQNIKAPAE